MSIELFNGDCLEVMKQIPDGSVDLVLTDPPYGTMNGAELDGWGKNKTDWDSTIPHERMLNECNRILRTNGALILFSQDPYTGKLMTDTHGNLPFSYRLTWVKDHFANALIAKKAPVNYTEDICVFFKKYDTLNQHPLREYSKEIIRYIGKNIKEINKDLGHRRAEHFFYTNTMQFGLCTEPTYNELIELYKIDKLDCFLTYNEMKSINRRFNRRFNLLGKRFKPNILEYKKDYEGLHPTQKPVSLKEDLIKTYSNENDTVLDFTMGSGTTGVAAKNLNRKFIGIELDREYFSIAEKRINDA
ncbi:MAG: site-specific DNA-methyltransferase [Gammaproteobacteria bacterium]|nr:site-specific DNA-methyltransferase [Gammaproteobacteria bacterium]